MAPATKRRYTDAEEGIGMTNEAAAAKDAEDTGPRTGEPDSTSILVLNARVSDLRDQVGRMDGRLGRVEEGMRLVGDRLTRVEEKQDATIKRLDELKADTAKQFAESKADTKELAHAVDTMTKWAIGLVVTVVVSAVATIVTVLVAVK